MADTLLGVGTYFGIQMRDFLKPGQTEAALIVEGIWQNRLATFEQNGNINVRHELTKMSSPTAVFF